MKRILILFILIMIVSIITKYFLSVYNISYTVDNYEVKTIYDSKRYYFEIKGESEYNFELYKKRGFKKLIIEEIIEIKDDNFNCIYPKINNVKTYPLCSNSEGNIDYNLIDSDKLTKYKKPVASIKKNNNFEFNSLDKDTYLALWNYKGFIVMNNNEYNNVQLFDNDKYDISLNYFDGQNIYLPNYDEDHEFKSLVKFNIKSFEVDNIKLEHSIDYDSYLVGNIKNKIYIFDNKYSKLYEINLKNGKSTIIGSNEKGYVKYEDGEFISCSKSEYKINKITYENNKITKFNEYKNIDNKIYKITTNNKNIKTKIIDNDSIIISDYQNDLYYVYDNVLYKYNPFEGSKAIFYYFELNFNTDNSIFIYNKY